MRQRCLLRALLGALAFGAVTPWSGARAQASAPDRFCFRGRPAPRCDRFMITEVGLYGRMAGSVTRAVQPGFDGVPPSTFTERDLSNQLSLELGAMKNRLGGTALGATVMASFGTSASLAIKGRHRRWLSPGGTALDLGVGPVLVGRAHSGGGPNTPGLTADVALNARDLGALVLRADVLRARDKTATALYGGARVGSQPALVATGALAVGLYLIIQALEDSF